MIYDTNNNRILSTGFAVRSEEVKTATIQIDCNAGYFLTCTDVDDLKLQVEVRHDGDAWVDIEATPIDLTPWDGDREIFEVRVTAATITSPTVRAFTLSVGR
jgi:hypothetical protein